MMEPGTGEACIHPPAGLADPSDAPASAQEQAQSVRLWEQNTLEPGTTCYVLPATWWNRWAAWSGYLNNDTAAVEGIPAGPIDCSSLLKIKDGKPAGIKDHLQQSKHFVIVQQQSWELLARCHGLLGEALPRSVVSDSAGNCRVALYPLRLDVEYVSSAGTSQTKLLESDMQATVGQFKSAACELFGVKEDDVELVDIWQNKVHSVLDDKLSLNISQAKLLPDQQVRLRPKGTVDAASDDEADATIQAGSLFDSGASTGMLTIINNNTSNTATTTCGSSKFGSSIRGMGALTIEDVANRCDGKRPGLAGLANLGNTCFMNSSLQCLAHAVPLVASFVSGSYRQDLNRTNALGLKGQLAEAFGALMNNLWKGGVSSVSPRGFKARIQKFASQFSGYQQHDSQEFLAYLLDGLHEDVNRIKNKPYIEDKDPAGRPDEALASEAWTNHRARNDSLVVDHFQGLLKSTLVCPNCHHASRKFDPYLYMSLPLPESRVRTINIVLVPMLVALNVGVSGGGGADGAGSSFSAAADDDSRAGVLATHTLAQDTQIAAQDEAGDVGIVIGGSQGGFWRPRAYSLEVPASGSIRDLLAAVARAAGITSAAPEEVLLCASVNRWLTDEVTLFTDVSARIADMIGEKRSSASSTRLMVYHYPNKEVGPTNGCVPLIVHQRRMRHRSREFFSAPLVFWLPPRCAYSYATDITEESAAPSAYSYNRPEFVVSHRAPLVRLIHAALLPFLLPGVSPEQADFYSASLKLANAVTAGQMTDVEAGTVTEDAGAVLESDSHAADAATGSDDARMLPADSIDCNPSPSDGPCALTEAAADLTADAAAALQQDGASDADPELPALVGDSGMNGSNGSSEGGSRGPGSTHSWLLVSALGTAGTNGTGGGSSSRGDGSVMLTSPRGDGGGDGSADGDVGGIGGGGEDMVGDESVPEPGTPPSYDAIAPMQVGDDALDTAVSADIPLSDLHTLLSPSRIDMQQRQQQAVDEYRLLSPSHAATSTQANPPTHSLQQSVHDYVLLHENATEEVAAAAEAPILEAMADPVTEHDEVLVQRPGTPVESEECFANGAASIRPHTPQPSTGPSASSPLAVETTQQQVQSAGHAADPATTAAECRSMEQEPGASPSGLKSMDMTHDGDVESAAVGVVEDTAAAQLAAAAAALARLPIQTSSDVGAAESADVVGGIEWEDAPVYGPPPQVPFNMWGAGVAPAAPLVIEDATVTEPYIATPAFRLLLATEKGDTTFSQYSFKAFDAEDCRHFTLDWPDMSSCYDLSALDSPDEDVSVVQARERTAAGPRSVSLSACVHAFLQPEQLGKDDTWYCPSCKSHVQADKKLDLWALPELLVVHLKRFSYSRYSRDKLDTQVDFPLEGLDLSSAVLTQQGKPPVYDLFAVSNHFGSLGGGHYTAYAKMPDDGRWYCFDDSHVSQVEPATVAGGSSAYVLFYRRRAEAQADPPHLLENLLEQQRALMQQEADAATAAAASTAEVAAALPIGGSPSGVGDLRWCDVQPTDGASGDGWTVPDSPAAVSIHVSRENSPSPSSHSPDTPTQAPLQHDEEQLTSPQGTQHTTLPHSTLQHHIHSNAAHTNSGWGHAYNHATAHTAVTDEFGDSMVTVGADGWAAIDPGMQPGWDNQEKGDAVHMSLQDGIGVHGYAHAGQLQATAGAGVAAQPGSPTEGVFELEVGEAGARPEFSSAAADLLARMDSPTPDAIFPPSEGLDDCEDGGGVMDIDACPADVFDDTDGAAADSDEASMDGGMSVSP